MTNNGFNRGFVQGNLEVDVKCTIAIEQLNARPLLEGINYVSNDVQITIQMGANVWVVTGVWLKDVSDDASGVGQEVKTTFNFGALQVTSAVSNSSLLTVAFNP